MITSKGYKIPLDHENINKIKKDLIIRPFIENAVSYPIYRVSDKNLFLPKYYGIKNLGLPDNSSIKQQEGLNCDFNFKGKLRDYQIDTCNTILAHLKKHDSGLASIYTGWGKTCAALWIASQLQRKTLIIVHTENLLNQWKDRIFDFLGEEAGTIQGPNINTKDKKIVIGMIQSISLKEYDPSIFKEFGLTLYDECHHTPGRSFSKIFYKIGTRYNLGLSATLTRADGLTKVIKYFIGETIVNLKLCTIIPKIIIKYSELEPLKEKTMVNGRINMAAMVNELADSFLRNVEIVKIIKEKYLEDRKILVLTDRRNHCTELKRLLGDSYSTGLYLGGMKNDKLQESNLKRVIFATYSMASEGYDNPELDTLIFATPKSKIEQAVGRILRQENKNEPEIIDLIDSFSIFNNLFFSRMKFYRSKKYISKLEKDDGKLEKYSIID